MMRDPVGTAAGHRSSKQPPKLARIQGLVDKCQLYSDLHQRVKARGGTFLKRCLSYSQKPVRRKGRGWLKVNFQVWFTAGQNRRPASPFSLVAVLCKRSPDEAFTPIETVKLPLQNESGVTEKMQGLLYISNNIPREALHIVLFKHESVERVVPRTASSSLPSTSSSGDFTTFDKPGVPQNVIWGAMPLAGRPLQNVPMRRGIMHVTADPGPARGISSFHLSHDSSADAYIGVCTVTSEILSNPATTTDGSLRVTQGERPVVFRFLHQDNETHYFSQAIKTPDCPFCYLACRSLLGLQQHMEACHDAFVYNFPVEHSDVVPVVNVRSRPDKDFDERDFFGPKSSSSDLTAPEMIAYYCPKQWRASREKLYTLDLRSRSKLPDYLLNVPKRISIESMELPNKSGKQQRAVKRPRVVQEIPAVSPTQLLKTTTFFHAKTHLPMTRKEVEMILKDPKSLPDSDDEEDLDAWKDKQKRTMRGKVDLTFNDRAYMYNWNVFMKENPVNADLQIPERCLQFCQKMAYKFNERKELRACLTAHLYMLWELALLKPSDFHACMQVVSAERPVKNGTSTCVQKKDPSPPAKHPSPPAKDPSPPVKSPSPLAKHPLPPARHPLPPAKRSSPPAKHPSPRAKHPSPPAKRPLPPAKHPSPPAKHIPKMPTPLPGNPEEEIIIIDDD